MKPLEPPPPSNPASGALSPAQEAGGHDETVAQVARARQGDEGAFRWLVDRHRDRAYGLAVRILRSASDAEDAAQEAFVKAWQALPRFRGDASFGTWLYRIVARQSFDRLEQLKRRRERETDLAAVAGVAAGAATEETDAARRVERLIELLSPAQRAVVTLFYYEDRSVEQVSELLEIPENTVKTHLSRARAQLRDAWLRGAGETA